MIFGEVIDIFKNNMLNIHSLIYIHSHINNFRNGTFDAFFVWHQSIFYQNIYENDNVFEVFFPMYCN